MEICYDLGDVPKIKVAEFTCVRMETNRSTRKRSYDTNVLKLRELMSRKWVMMKIITIE